MSEWHKVAARSAVPDGGALRVTVGNQAIALYNLEGRIYATDDVCTHAFASLSDGYVDGENIECPLHQAQFHIPTGKVITGPATEDVKTFDVKVEGDDVYVHVVS